MIKIKVIDYKAGNAPSVIHAVERLGLTGEYARCGDDLKDATHIILPGVGSAGATMNSLRQMGLIAPLETAVLENKIPFLGICVGMQILFEHSEEEDTRCLGWLKGRVVKFDKSRVRVPQMGWNKVEQLSDFFYFVNSYYAVPQDTDVIWGTARYDVEFAAAVKSGNIYATQFHAEKSGEAGLLLLKNFFEEVIC
ncbi:MAG: imidazole glycerol phosphate synthase subunit HisH [Oscillospiraceae bacterium]|nr:imidazole glycerol phosphate synthase subunit HisH [Oscillospiraceae bacterium]